MKANKENSAGVAALLGLLTAVSLIFGYVEAILPFNLGIPGVKLGLANLVVVISLYTLSTEKAFFIDMVRILLSGLLFGTLVSLAYSLAGGLLSFGAMVIAKKLRIFGISGVSVLGGVFHNIGQLLVAIAVLGEPLLGWYFPVLLLAGAAAGFLIGIAAGHSIPLLQKIIAKNDERGLRHK